MTDQSWRGVATEDSDELSAGAGLFLRARSRRLLGELLQPHRRSLWWLLATVVAQNAAWLAGPLLIGVGIDVGVPALVDGDAWPLVWITAAMVVAAVLDTVLRFAFLTGSGRVGQAVLLTLRRRVFTHVQVLPLSFHERYTSGRTISRLTSDAEALAELLDEGLDGLITALFSVLGIGIVLVVLDPPLGLTALLGFPALFLVARWFQRNSTAAYRRTRETIAALIVQFTETFGGIRAVQAFRREPRNDELYAVLNEDNRQAHHRAFWLIAVFVPAVVLIGNVVTVAVLGYGALRVMDGAMAVGTLVSFLLYLRRFFDPLQDIAMFYNSYQSATAALEKLSGVLEESPSVPEPVDPVPLPAAAGEVVFDDVRFGYGDATVLPGLVLTLPPGETVALVGTTGAGKSTLARLAARFYDPVEGEIRLDGVPLHRLTDADLRRAVVMVTQESFLFSGTVADNIAFGRPGADRAEIERAARAIGAHDFITALPDGYDTEVDKRGGRLSAGQRQLVSFARAFLADPAVLILDEATSSLDVPSERLVQHALRTLLADRTALIIAHRLSTVEIADRVLVMEGGRIVEDGSPADLVAGTGRFAALHQAWADSLV
ncbi:ABC-type multidrug transport system, ATPase and permease component [Blastococcus aurantiacus]|uniref:ABC-type multidrug transport system, ATPase and permease component n=1 Tax=Blastococcus aurantiacus TaxID=1550231 RepID=A0A1G7JUQ8_9ACTN|nr:ABC transporter ATP-binding protein [Blastococcus aurantiacus]SDF28700.1 ABC-type multidrug transport system, ATPase and permease component [Blastococcus aurantiacus]